MKLKSYQKRTFILFTISIVCILFSEISVFKIYIILNLVSISTLFYIFYWIFLLTVGFRIFKKADCVERLGLDKLSSTKDISVPSQFYKSYNSMEGLSLVRFFFDESKTYLVYRNYFPFKIYNGPFTISKHGENADFKIEKFEFNQNDAIFIIVSNESNEKHHFRLTNISEEDIQKLQIIC